MSNASSIGPDRKQIQYDRQLRLWGDHGQKALENGRVCLIGADALGTEILKSLVLPGLGSFTIIDDQRVSSADCGSNFFVHPSTIGQSRARVTCDFLKELNPDVHGQCIDQPSIDELLKQNTFDFSSFHVVITSNLTRKTLLHLAQRLWSMKIPLLSARTYGFIGTLRLQVNEHFVMEAHPDDTVPDLRLDRPLKSFVEHSDSIDLNALTRDEHLHLPSLILLHKTLQLWQKQTERTDLPRTRQEKENFKQLLDQLSRFHDDVETKHLENFDEAKRTIPSRLVSTTVPSTIRELFHDPACLQLNERTPIFWFILHAMKLFVDNEGQGLLPVRGEIPDMITNTSSYVKLVRIYQEQAKRDVELVYNYLLDLLTKHNESLREQANLHHLVQIFCKNASFLRVIRSKPIRDDEEFLDANATNVSWLVGLRVCDLFHEQYGRYPGEFPFSSNDSDADQRRLEIDLNDLKQIGKKFFQSHSISNENQQTILEELGRYGAAELHSIGAFVGGCCAQETIKLITHQYVPIDNTLIYNAIEQTTSLLTL